MFRIKKMFILLLVFCFVTTVFSGRIIKENYDDEFIVDGFTVEKELEVIGEEILDIVRQVSTYKYHTNVFLTVKNDNLPKRWFEIRDCHSGPEGTTVQNISNNGRIEGNCVVWRFEGIKSYDRIKVSYSVATDMNEVFKPEIEYKNKKVKLIIPTSAYATEEIIITVMTKDNIGVPNFEVSVETPDGAIKTIKSNEDGVIRYKLNRTGKYLFICDDKKYEMEVKPLNVQPGTAAMIVEEGDFKPSDFLPVFIALIVLAIVLIILLGYYSSKSKEDDVGKFFRGHGVDDKPSDKSDEFQTGLPVSKDSASKSDLDYEESKLYPSEKKTEIRNAEEPSEPSEYEDIDQQMEEIKELTKRIAENREKVKKLVTVKAQKVEKGIKYKPSEIRKIKEVKRRIQKRSLR